MTQSLANRQPSPYFWKHAFYEEYVFRPQKSQKPINRYLLSLSIMYFLEPIESPF